MTDRTLRPLTVALVVQVLIGAALVVWAALGFPLPGDADEPAPTTAPATSRRPPAAVSPSSAASRFAPRPTTAPATARRPPAAVPPPAQSGLPPRATVDRFDGARAFALLREQVREYGWRPAGSRALRRLAVRLRALLPHGRFEAIPGHPRLRNVVGSLPGRGPAIVVGAHYDVEARPVGFVGANDGAAGTAAVVEIARALARAPRAARDRAVRFVLFDGEEEPAGCRPFLACGLRGSNAYAGRHAGEVRSLVLLDYIAERRGLSFPREGGSDADLWQRLRSAAATVGVGALFPDTSSGRIFDDHTPFTARGIPAIDIIDFDYPPRDTLADTLDKVSARSLDAVGEAVVQLLTGRAA
jgi:glutaminyl-peptide cyclotransferase